MEAEAGVSDARIVQAVQQLLASADLAQTTTKLVMGQLEEKLGVSVADKKAVVKQAIADFAMNAAQQPQELHTTQEDSTSDGEKEDGKQAAEEASGESDNEQDEGEEGEEEEEEDDNTPVKKRKRGNGGFTVELQLSTELSEFMNSITSTRTEVVKAMWEYIKAHNLQDPADRRKIRCDDTLQRIFKRKTLTMFNMNKFLTQHMKAVHELPDVKEDIEPAPKKASTRVKAEADAKVKPEGKAKRAKRESKINPNNPFHKAQRLSPQLSELLGEPELSRPQVVKHMWKYIKDNSLQDPNDGRNILCDRKLREIFGVSSFTGFSMNKLLKEHIGV